MAEQETSAQPKQVEAKPVESNQVSAAKNLFVKNAKPYKVQFHYTDNSQLFYVNFAPNETKELPNLEAVKISLVRFSQSLILK